MMSTTDLTIFWKESATYIGLYAGLALLIGLLGTTFEWYRQSSTLSWTVIGVKYLLLMVANIALFTLALWIMGWKGRLLGSELLTSIGLVIAWFIASYALQLMMNQRLSLGLHHPSLSASITTALLLAPFAIFNVFILLLGSAFKN